MAKADKIPAPVVRRLSLYLRQLESLEASEGLTVSSKQLGAPLKISDAQVRKDLACFGQFGHPGIGYRVSELIHRCRRILGTDKVSKVLLVGVGNLGRALLFSRGFARRGFEIVAAFDNDPNKIGMMADESSAVRVRGRDEMPEVVRTLSIRLGVLVVPAPAAQSVADEMVAAGVRGILNFAPVRLSVDADVFVSSVDLAVHLEQLSFQLHSAGS